MPLYDCMLLMKSNVTREMAVDLVTRLGQRVYQRNGVITDIKSFGSINLGYTIKKIDGRHYGGRLMQLTMMVPPSFHKEIHYLNKEDRLLRWMVVKHRNVVYGLEAMNMEEGVRNISLFKKGSLISNRFDNKDSDEDDYDDDYDEEDLEK